MGCMHRAPDAYTARRSQLHALAHAGGVLSLMQTMHIPIQRSRLGGPRQADDEFSAQAAMACDGGSVAQPNVQARPLPSEVKEESSGFQLYRRGDGRARDTLAASSWDRDPRVPGERAFGRPVYVRKQERGQTWWELDGPPFLLSHERRKSARLLAASRSIGRARARIVRRRGAAQGVGGRGEAKLGKRIGSKMPRKQWEVRCYIAAARRGHARSAPDRGPS